MRTIKRHASNGNITGPLGTQLGCCCHGCPPTSGTITVVFSGITLCACLPFNDFSATPSHAYISGSPNGAFVLTWDIGTSTFVGTTPSITVREYAGAGCTGSYTDSTVTFTIRAHCDTLSGAPNWIITTLGFATTQVSGPPGHPSPVANEFLYCRVTPPFVPSGHYGSGTGGTATVSW